MAALDGLETRDKATDEEAEALLGRKVGHSLGDFLLSVLAFSGTKRDEWREVEVALPATEDPWYLAYLTALGVAKTAQSGVRRLGAADPDPEWSRVIPVSFGTVATPGPADLLRRLRSYESPSPVSMTATFLGLSQAPRDEGIGDGATRIPRRRPLGLAMIGPNIVVVYQPGSVEDLCLVWTLRGR